MLVILKLELKLNAAKCIDLIDCQLCRILYCLSINSSSTGYRSDTAYLKCISICKCSCGNQHR